MTISVDEIVRLYTERMSASAMEVASMRELTAAYDGSVAVPLPELDRNERVAVANLIATGLDQQAMRIASQLPDVFFPALKPGIKASEANARDSRMAVLGWWDASEMDLKLGRRARWLIGYACAPAKLCWNAVDGVPRWVLRDPLSTFPARGDDPDCMVPDDCLYGFKRSLGWLQHHYPDQYTVLSKGKDHRPDTLFELIEYNDCEETVLVVVGRARDPYDRGQFGMVSHVELDRAPNRAGVPLTFVPGRITLSQKRQGAFDGLIGIFQQQAKLMALEVIAVTRGVFPDTWGVSRANEQVQIRQIANGRRNIPGQIDGGELVQLPFQPGYKTDQTIDRLERAMRTEGGIPADVTGESASNVRTGRRGQDILSATIDFNIAEAQKILARSLQHENKAAIAMAKAYAGGTPKSFYVGLSMNRAQKVEYTPDKTFTSDFHTVSYVLPGSDPASAAVGIGQRLGMGEMSLHTGRQLDPWIDDPEAEADWIIAEKLEGALLASVVQQAQSGQLGVADVARIMDAVKSDRLSLDQAVLQVQKAKQTEQATAGAPGTPEGPVAPGAPEAQPGLTPPGAAAPQAGTMGPTPNQQGLAALLGALKTGAQSPVPSQAA